MFLEEQIFARHVGKKILLDSNCARPVGRQSRSRLFGSFKRDQRVSIDDLSSLEGGKKVFRPIHYTHILLKSQLANSLTEQWREDWLAICGRVSCLNCKPLSRMLDSGKQLV